ncbi:MAG: hypothetical protein KY469_15865 [Actinobacteria bacterium]|nr:hypothetical protein [Actinomycetota bacterium]
MDVQTEHREQHVGVEEAHELRRLLHGRSQLLQHDLVESGSAQHERRRHVAQQVVTDGPARGIEELGDGGQQLHPVHLAVALDERIDVRRRVEPEHVAAQHLVRAGAEPADQGQQQGSR